MILSFVKGATNQYMHTTQEPDSGPVKRGALVLHVRRLRQWYGERGLAQEELAKVAGVSPRLVRSYESCRTLPGCLASLLAIALALQVPIEGLVDPRVTHRLREQVDKRRHAHERKGRRGDARHVS